MDDSGVSVGMTLDVSSSNSFGSVTLVTTEDASVVVPPVLDAFSIIPELAEIVLPSVAAIPTVAQGGKLYYLLQGK